MSTSEQDSRALDDCRRKNDELYAEIQRLRKEIERLDQLREDTYRKMRDLMRNGAI